MFRNFIKLFNLCINFEMTSYKVYKIDKNNLYKYLYILQLN